MASAGFAHLTRTIAFGKHHHRAAKRLELVDIGIHATGRRRAERTRCITRGRFGRTGIIDRVVLKIIRHGFAVFQPFADFRMRQIAGDDNRPCQRKLRLDRMLGQLLQNFGHRLVEVDLHDMRGKLFLVDIRHVLRGVGFQLFQEDAFLGDLALGLTICGARHADADWQRCAMARQADNTHVMAEIFAAELRADAQRLGQLVDFGFHFQIAERVAGFRTRRRQAVEIARGGELDGLEVHLG